MIPILIGVVVVALATPAIAWLVSRWADREEAAERERFDRIMAANEPPRAAGLKSDHRRVG